MYHSEELRGFYRTLGEDFGLTAERAGQDLQRSIAKGLCQHTNHYPKPCLSCIELARPLVKPFGRALKHAAMFERRNREVGYVAMGQGLDVLEREVTQ